MVSFYRPGTVEDGRLKFAVIAARYEDKWVFCRHRERTTWEIPGGHREVGETVEECARRELAEETGAVLVHITPVSVYGVKGDWDETYGMLFFAEIHSLGELDENSEIGEVKLFETMPRELTYPHIQPHLFLAVQGWLNVQSSADELWDVYDGDRHPTGRLHRRGDPLREGDFHIVVHVWMKNSRGEFLLTKRAPTKGFPNMWESTGGSALAGDDSLGAAIREVKEETGLDLDPACGRCVLSYKREDSFVDVWLFLQDFDLSDVILLEGETTDKMYADAATIRSLVDAGMFVPYRYLDEILDMK